jgi:hypothetical protein
MIKAGISRLWQAPNLIILLVSLSAFVLKRDDPYRSVKNTTYTYHVWLVVYLALSKMMEFVTWDDDIPKIWKK